MNQPGNNGVYIEYRVKNEEVQAKVNNGVESGPWIRPVQAAILQGIANPGQGEDEGRSWECCNGGDLIDADYRYHPSALNSYGAPQTVCAKCGANVTL